MPNNHYRRYAAGWLLLMVTACSAGGGAGPEQRPAAGDDGSGQPPWAVSYVPAPGLDGIMPALARHRVVYVGETHDRYDHHLAQLRVIEALYRDDPDLAIGLEFFQQPFQPVLDDWVAGRIDEAQLLRDSEYYRRWGFDYRLYRPILQFAREHRVPLVALNVARELTDAVKRHGIDGLPPAQRSQLPEQLDRTAPGYRERLRGVYLQHGGNTGAGFERFFEVQLVWDEGMADRAARYLAEHPGRRLVVLAGSGHLNQPDGIPDRLDRRMPVDAAAVVLGSPYQYSDRPASGYYLATRPQALPPPARLGVMLSGDNLLTVSGFSKTSRAPAGGLRKGDRIAAVEGVEVADLSALKLVLIRHKAGDRVQVTVARPDDRVDETRVLTLELE